MANKTPHHLGIISSDAKCAIITGDPDRVVKIATLLTNSQKISDARGYLCYKASIGEIPVLVIGSGIGGPSTAIAIEELVEIGVQIIIRIGTCGALQRNIKVGDLIIPTGCVREEGTTAQYIEQIFPAVPDFELLKRMVDAAKTIHPQIHIGVTHCKDAYYLELPNKQLLPEKTGLRWKVWQQAGVLATEMESSILFVLGSLRKIRTGSIFINVGKETNDTIFQQSLKNAVTIVSETISSLVNEFGFNFYPEEKIDNSSYLDNKKINF